MMQRLLYFVSVLGFLFAGIVANAEDTGGNTQTALSAKQLVVMIDGRFPTTGRLTSGAGIVVGRKGGLVYIATAGHVVRSFAETAENIKIQFADRPGEEVDATPWPSNLDKNVDLAVLVVPENRVPETITATDQFSAARVSEHVKTGEGVYLFGQPGGKVWSGNKSPEKVVSSTSTVIEIESRTIVPGLSGGATFDEAYRIIGLIVETENGLARAIPLKFLKETLERGGYPFDLVDTEVQIAVDSEHAQRIKTLRSLGIEFDKAGFWDAIINKKAEALRIFHEAEPFFSDEEFFELVMERQQTLPFKSRANIAKYAGTYDLPHIRTLKGKLKTQVDFVSGFLKNARKSGLSVARLCNEYNSLEPVLFALQENACEDGADFHLYLLSLHAIAEGLYGAKNVEINHYALQNYEPVWFLEGKTPPQVKVIELNNPESEATIPDCGYSIAKSRFTVWEENYTIIPEFGKAIFLKNALYQINDKKARDAEVCFTIYYNGVKNSMHVQCDAEVLFYKSCDYKNARLIGVRNHLISKAEIAERLSNLPNIGRLTDQSWRASDEAASIWPSETNNRAIFFLSCLGNYIFVRSEISSLLGALPNLFEMKFIFGDEEKKATFVGQSRKDGSNDRPYVAFFSRSLLHALAGRNNSVAIFIEDKPIGTLPLKDSTWALSKGLSGCF